MHGYIKSSTFIKTLREEKMTETTLFLYSDRFVRA